MKTKNLKRNINAILDSHKAITKLVENDPYYLSEHPELFRLTIVYIQKGCYEDLFRGPYFELSGAEQDLITDVVIKLFPKNHDKTEILIDFNNMA